MVSSGASLMVSKKVQNLDFLCRNSLTWCQQNLRFRLFTRPSSLLIKSASQLCNGDSEADLISAA